jgi:hypothetical protein
MAAPHFGQEAARDAPQFVQNLRPSRFSQPHFEQRMLIAQLVQQPAISGSGTGFSL